MGYGRAVRQRFDDWTMKDVSETVEFFIPNLGLDVQPYIAADSKQGIHHVGRYQWAHMVLSELKPKRVIDIACGAGYGTRVIADALQQSEVIGVDYDPRAVTYAQSHYSAPNVSFLVGSIVTWTSEKTPLGSCDAIVSFDTIEHISHREIAMESIVQNLSRHGVLLLSTPCGHSETRLNPDWAHHKIEFSHEDLFVFLRRYFGHVIQPQDPDFIHAEFWSDLINRGETRYLNRMNPVICCDPIPPKRYQPGI